MHHSLKRRLSITLVLLTALAACGTASAGRVYSGVGFHSYHPYHRHYGYPYGGVHYGVGYYGRGDDTAAAVVIGMLLGAALAQSSHPDYGQVYYPPYAYAPPPGYAYPPRVAVPARVRHVPETRASWAGTCRQVREYWTTVTIGGKKVQAYGPACLQPDGSWRRGPARLADYP